MCSFYLFTPLYGHNSIFSDLRARGGFGADSWDVFFLQLPTGQVLLLVFGQLIDLDAPGFQPFAGDHIVDLL